MLLGEQALDRFFPVGLAGGRSKERKTPWKEWWDMGRGEKSPCVLLQGQEVISGAFARAGQGSSRRRIDPDHGPGAGEKGGL